MYENLKFPYKRGIILHGPPGNGKTTVLRESSMRLIKNGGVVLEINDIHKLNKMLDGFSKIEPNREIMIILEDLDKIIEKDEEDLTQILDGVIFQKEKVLFVATTNYLDKIPERIKERSSRFDSAYEFPSPSEEERHFFVSKLLENESDQKVFLDYIVKETDGYSYAEIKGIIINCKIYSLNIKEALERRKQTKMTFN